MTTIRPFNGKIHGLLALWEVLKVLVVPLAFALGGFLVGHEIRLSLIEDNRFTDQDAAELRQEILKERPPPWLTDDLKQLQKHCRETELQLSDLLARVKALEKE